jgi:hypothetical protein
LLFFVLFAPALVIDWYLLMQPIKAAIADIDSAQYLNSWSAGWGVREVNTILTREAEKNPKVYIGTEGTFGLMPYALEIYQHGNARVVIKSYWPPPLALPPELLAAAQQYPVFWLVYQRAGISPEWPADLVARFRQGESSDFLQLYKVRPQ